METPSARLCLSCGLCCNGSIYDQAKLEPDEVAAINRFGADISAVGSNPFLNLPCTLLSGTRCTIYESRPGVCRRFRCGVLQSLEVGEIDESDAQRRVATARALADAVRPFLAPGETMTAARQAWLAWSRDQSGTLAPHLGRLEAQRFHLAMLALNRFLDMHFRKPHQVMTREVAEETPPASGRP